MLIWHLFLYANLFGLIVLLLAFHRQHVQCAALVATGRIATPASNTMVISARGGSRFASYILTRQYQSSSDPQVVTAFDKLRWLLLSVVTYLVVLSSVSFWLVLAGV
jgi:hypothetical protein